MPLMAAVVEPRAALRPKGAGRERPPDKARGGRILDIRQPRTASSPANDAVGRDASPLECGGDLRHRLLDMLLPQFDRELGITRRLIEAAPEADLTWAPGGNDRTTADLMTHLADIPAWTRGIVEADGRDLAEVRDPATVTSAAAGLERFDAAAAAGRRAVAGCPDGELTADWTLRRRGRVLFSLPRIAALQTLVLNHVIHHRGQLSVHLRMRGVRVPPIYRLAAGAAADDRAPAARRRR